MKAGKIRILSAEQALKESGMTREEWNENIVKKVKEIEADESLSQEEKDKQISNLLMQLITVNNRFLLEELLEGDADG